MLRVIIFLIGAPLCGKSTQIHALERSLKNQSTFIMLGKIVREYANTHASVDRMIRKGMMAPENITRNIFVKSALNSQTTYTIVDGYPRTLPQISAVEQVIKNFDKAIAIEMYMPASKLIERMHNRKVCSKCDKSTTSQQSTCISCGNALIKRMDDNVSSLATRIEFHIRMKDIMRALMKNRMNYFQVNANTEIDDLSKKILDIIKNSFDNITEEKTS